MKYLFTIAITLVFATGFSQKVIRIPEPGSFILLQDSWKYRAEDKQEYKETMVDDSQWKVIHPAGSINDSLPIDMNNTIGWMRFKFILKSNERNQPVAFMIHQSVASEIYLNGKLIEKFGSINNNPFKVKAFDPRWTPIVLNIPNDNVQVLAIRFAAESGIIHVNHFGTRNPIFEVRLIQPVDAVIKKSETFQRSWIDIINIGIMLVVFIVHLAFYFMFPEQKANLYFSIFAFLYMLATTSHLWYYYAASPETKHIFAQLASFVYQCSSALLLFSIYKFLSLRKGNLFYLWCVLAFTFTVCHFFWPNELFGISILSGTILLNMVILVASIEAVKYRKPGAIPILVGNGLSLLTSILFFIFILKGSNSDEILWIAPLNIASFTTLLRTLSIPAALSFVLASDFALTSRRLTAKLKQVEELSANKLQIEEEKQAILSSQNSWLEQRVYERTNELEKTIRDLKSTQSQLIQSEKMASLGELTAGIAHEIQNPLNFVNNFSEVNTELIKEFQDERSKTQDQRDEQLENDLLKDISENMVKINHHGKRAADIVKSMLQHSRTSTGQKELTDVNALCDEYLRLSYHGLRAKDKSFNAKFETDFNSSLPKVNVIPQDIGRVILNLITNAFYAVNEKSKQVIADYEPIVTVTTKHSPLLGRGAGGEAIITVKDNGNGIPDSIKEKIFQPFFTTKPTGQGTGLGLSLSYDIVKAHGGELKVETKEGEGSEFIIELPYAQ